MMSLKKAVLLASVSLSMFGLAACEGEEVAETPEVVEPAAEVEEPVVEPAPVE